MRLYSAQFAQLEQERAVRAQDASALVRGWNHVCSSLLGALDPQPWRKLPTRQMRAKSPDADGFPAPVDDALIADALLATRARSVESSAHVRIMHVIGSLAAGGAERQAVYLARETCRRGVADASLTLTNPLVGSACHYLPLAQQGGVEVRVAGASVKPEAIRALQDDRPLGRMLSCIDRAYADWCIDLAGECLALRPDVVHAWLDHANMCAGIAALATGVPRIVLSTRNVNPTHFPSLQSPHFLPWYRVFARSPRVSFIANSEAGAEDYARWIGIPRERFHVIVNGIDPSAAGPLDASALDALRSALRADGCDVAGKRVVLGVFRIAEEKQPLVWAEAVLRVLASNPDVVVLHAGDGPMREELAHAMRSAPADRFRMLGVRSDVAALMTIADLLLHASRQEGTPNAIIEAQSMGCPVIATNAPGTVAAVEDGASGMLQRVGDASGLAECVLRVLQDDALHGAMKERARVFARQKFGLDGMVDASLAVCGIDANKRQRT